MRSTSRERERRAGGQALSLAEELAHDGWGWRLVDTLIAGAQHETWARSSSSWNAPCGEPRLGTTYVDETSLGPTPGEIAEFEPPHTLVYHWWDRSKAGKLKLEGWPAYSLSTDSPGTTIVHLHARMHAHGLYRLATPVLRRLALKERTTTIDALAASFESGA